MNRIVSSALALLLAASTAYAGEQPWFAPAPGGSSSGLTIGTTTVTGCGTSGFVLYNNAGSLGCQASGGGFPAPAGTAALPGLSVGTTAYGLYQGTNTLGVSVAGASVADYGVTNAGWTFPGNVWVNGGYLQSSAGMQVIATTTLTLGSGGASLWNLQSSGTFTLSTGNAYDIATAANPLRTLYAASFSSAGTVPTTTTGTCTTIGAATGGATAGKFTTTTGCGASTTIILSGMPATTNGYACNAQDQTTTADTVVQTASSTTSATFKVSATATSDVISYHCTGY